MSGKAHLVTVGMAVALLVTGPLTLAGHGHDSDSDDQGSSSSCPITGGNADAQSDNSGSPLANTVAQAPIAGNNIGNIANCASLLNHNDVHILSVQ